MRVPRIFVSIDIQKDDCINLEEAESRYVTAVLRLKIKNEVILFNGTGYEYHGCIQEIQKKSVLISIKTISLNEIYLLQNHPLLTNL